MTLLSSVSTMVTWLREVRGAEPKEPADVIGSRDSLGCDSCEPVSTSRDTLFQDDLISRAPDSLDSYPHLVTLFHVHDDEAHEFNEDSLCRYIAEHLTLASMLLAAPNEG